MPIVVVREKERLTLDWDSTTRFFYRRVPAPKKAEILQKHTLFGTLNDLACQVELCEFAITGWEGEVYDDDGSLLVYKLENVAVLPTVVFGRMMLLINEAAPEQMLKNWQRRSNGVSS